MMVFKFSRIVSFIIDIMTISRIIVFCALFCFVQCVPEIKVHGEITNNCPDLSLSDENPWCLNCTFYDDQSCTMTNEHTETHFGYKTYKCPNNNNCILPASWSVQHKNEIVDGSQIYLYSCPNMDDNEPNRLCNNCSAGEDSFCDYEHSGIRCQLREFNCPEFDRGCFVVHNCTAAHIENVPIFQPKLISFDGKEELETTVEGNCSAMPTIEENPGCTNCLFLKEIECRIVTNYTETTCNYHEFRCPENDDKACTVSANCRTNYGGYQKEVAFCPYVVKDAHITYVPANSKAWDDLCTNCTHIRDLSCSYSRDWYTHWNCHYKEFKCPESREYYVKMTGCAAPVSAVPLYSSEITPAALASLAGAG